MVTTRPGRGAPFLVVVGLLIVVATLVLGPRLSSARQDWAGGTPALFVVVGPAPDGQTRLDEVSGDRSWTVETKRLAARGDTTPGTRLLGRIGGDCRCRLLLDEPQGIPTAVPVLGLLIAAVAVPGMLARLRWRRLGAVRASPGRPASISSVWLRRGYGPARLGVVASTDGQPDLYVELEGTPLTWWLQDHAATVQGPHPGNGLTALTNSSGQIAVASAAGLVAERGARRVAPWSDALCRATGLARSDAESPLHIGGDQRIRVTASADGPALHPMPSARGRRQLAWTLPLYAVLLLLLFLVHPSQNVLFGVYVAFLVIVRLISRYANGLNSGAPPFDTWPDRRAAGEAALAAGRLGFAAANRGGSRPAPPGSRPGTLAG